MKSVSVFMTIYMLLNSVLFNTKLDVTNYNLDKNKSSVSILDDTFAVEIQNTNRPSILTGSGEVEDNELWIKYDTGKKVLLVTSKEDTDVTKTIAGIHNPRISMDGKKVYFMSYAWATSNSIHVVDVQTKEVKYICPGNYLEVVRNGEYQGKLIVNQHRYYDEEHGYGSYDNYYIIDEEGKELKNLGGEEPPKEY